MKVKLWGTRGSLASPGPHTLQYGGNTSCVSVQGEEGTYIVLDAGTGIRDLGVQLPKNINRLHVLLTHLHMDHLQGLPFFAPLRRQGVEVHIWGPPSNSRNLRQRVLRYLSPPLFPVSLREISNELIFHDLPFASVEIEEFEISAELIIHPNPTIGYRISCGGRHLTYLPDHEPALGANNFPLSKEWTSGYRLAEGCDLLIHDAQYFDEEYPFRVGFGHSSMSQAFKFAELVCAKRFIPFHHDPSHGDDELDQVISRSIHEIEPPFVVTPGKEGTVINLNAD